METGRQDLVFEVYDLVGTQPLRVVKETCTVGIAKIAAVLKSGVNFTNILQAAFTPADPKSKKKTVKSSSFLLFWDLHM